MPRDPGKPRSHTSARPSTPYLLRRSSRMLNTLLSTQQPNQESRYPGPSPDNADSCNMVKTPVRGCNQSSVTISNSDKTHPEPLSATQAVQPYYGPALATPQPAPCRLGQSLQRQYAKIFHVDDAREERSSDSGQEKAFRQIDTKALEFCRFHPRDTEPWYKPIFGLYNTPYGPGSRYKDFCNVISQCIQCKSIMARTYMEYHKCPVSEEEIALASPSTVEGFLHGLDNMTQLLGVSLDSFTSLYVQCDDCHAIVAKGVTQWHVCPWDDKYDVAQRSESAGGGSASTSTDSIFGSLYSG